MTTVRTVGVAPDAREMRLDFEVAPAEPEEEAGTMEMGESTCMVCLPDSDLLARATYCVVLVTCSSPFLPGARDTRMMALVGCMVTSEEGAMTELFPPARCTILLTFFRSAAVTTFLELRWCGW